MNVALHVRRLAAGVGPVAACALVVVASLAAPQRVKADGASEAVEKRERCATRLTVALLGKSPSAQLLASADPQTSVETLLDEGAPFGANPHALVV